MANGKCVCADIVLKWSFVGIAVTICFRIVIQITEVSAVLLLEAIGVVHMWQTYIVVHKWQTYIDQKEDNCYKQL